MGDDVHNKMLTRLRHGWLRAKAYIGRPRLVVQTKPVLVSDSDVCEMPLFIIGAHRSGTSLVRRIINAHSAFACPPETYFLTHFATMLRDPNTCAGFEGLGYLSKAEVTCEIRRWATQYHEAFRKAVGKRRWADKTPQYWAILPELRALFAEAVRFLIVVRDPRDVVYSIYSRGWRLGNFHSDNLLNAAMYVSEGLERQHKFLKEAPDLCHLLRYEELIEDPEATLRKVFQFLNEPWEREVLTYEDHPHNFGTEDPIASGASGFRKNSGNYLMLPAARIRDIAPHLSKAAAEFGYSVE